MPVLQDLAELAPLVTPVAGLIGASTGEGAVLNQANQATNTIKDTQAQNAATQADVLAQQKQLLNPWYSAGTSAVNTLSTDPSVTAPFSYSAADMVNDPGYQFRVNEGEKGINTAAAARGLWNSGGTMKALNQYDVNQANQYYGQDYARSENTFRANQASRLDLLKNLSASGQQAANTESAATGAYGAASTQNNQFTAQELTQIQSQIADAQASGDVAKANALGSLISGAVSAAPTIAKIAGLTSNAAKLATPAISSAATTPSAISAATGVASAIPGTALGLAVPEAAAIPGLSSMAGTSMGIGALAPTAPVAAAPPAAASSATGLTGALGSIGHAAIGFLTNPITIGVGAAIIAVTAILKSQAHWEANTLVKDVQKPFGESLGKIVNGFDQALASGQLDKATAQQMRDQTAQVINDFNNAVYQFAQKGGDNKTVALNAMQTMADDFGARSDYPNLPSYDKILGKMDAEIAQLPEAA
jgi:hypothetical protein